MPNAVIKSLDQEGRGVAHCDGKTVFIEGALPGEVVEFSSYRKKPTFEIATLTRVVKASPLRTTPRCAFFSVCGGCSMQHLDVRAQVAVKQRVLEDNLWHIGRVVPETILPAIHGPAWGYRHRARLSARYVVKKGGMLVGFREKRSSYVADMTGCEILPPRVSALLVPLRELLGGLSINTRVPQVEVSVGLEALVLVVRILAAPSQEDENLLRQFAERHAVHIFLQPKGPDSAFRFAPAHAPDLYYAVPEFELEMRFAPTDFTQVNPAVNRVLVRRAMRLLDPRPGERVADFFCGLGNFTLAIARSGAHVIGLEGSADLVGRARANASLNGLADRAEFRVVNLFDMNVSELSRLGKLDCALIDPPRDGAIEVVKSIDEMRPGRIVYVSCNPATLARDAAVLVNTQGYALRAAGVVNMFPHTSHVESIAFFER
jgi:23S rRNA (uracil1939-C5)-methyltransferase